MPKQTIRVKQPKNTDAKNKFVQSLDEDELQAMEIIKQEFKDAFWIEQTNGFLQFSRKKQ